MDKETINKCDADYYYCKSHGKCTLKDCKSYTVNYQQTKHLTEQLENRRLDLLGASKTIIEQQAELDEYCHKTEGLEIHVNKLTEQLAEANGCVERQARIYHEQVKELAEKEKELSEVKELYSYILEIDFLTTKEFCDKFNVPHPKFTGEVESSVCDMLRIDAVKHRMFVEKAKQIRKSLTQPINNQ